MTQQRLVRRILALILLGFAVAVGSVMFSEHAFSGNRENINDDLRRIAVPAYQYYRPPAATGTQLQRSPLSVQSLSAPQGQIWVIDTAVVYSYRDTTRHLYAYDGSGKMTTDLAQKWTGGLWQDSVRETRTYDASGRLWSYLSEARFDGQWTSLTRYAMTYNPNGKITSNVLEGCSNGWWVSHFRENWTYDAGGNLTSYLHERGTNGQWVNEYRYTNTYSGQKDTILELAEIWSNGQWVVGESDTIICNSNGKPTSQLGNTGWYFWAWGERTSGRVTDSYDDQGNLSCHIEEGLQNGQWVTWYRSTWAYDADRNMTSVLDETNPYDGPLRNSRQETYAYDGQDHLTSMLSQYWDTGQWATYVQVAWTYDANGRMTSYLTEYPYSGGSVPGIRDTFFYDANGNCASVCSYAWLNSTWVPLDDLVRLPDIAGNEYAYNGHNVSLTFRNLVTTVNPQNGSNPEVYSLSQNYPNPFNPLTVIRFTIAGVGTQESGARRTTLIVYDVLGREVARLVDEVKAPGSYQVQFDGSRLASGVYFYKLQAGDFAQSKKLLLLK